MAYTTQIGHRTTETKRERRSGLNKLLICTILFFFAVTAKIAGVPAVRDTICGWIEMGSVEESLAVLGMSVSASDYSVTEVFTDWVTEVFAVDSLSDETIPVSASPTEKETAVQTAASESAESLPAILPVDETAWDPMLSAVSAAIPQGHISIGDATEYTLPAEETSLGSDLPLPEAVSAETGSIDFGYVTPVAGYITSAFGYRDHPLDGEYKFHYGIDIGASEGTPILAFADGVVNTVLQGEINGNYFKVRHDDGIVSMYAHCQKIVVKAGQQVKKGDVIAYVGQTGQVSGPHLHFQLYRNGKIIDPTGFLEVSA